MDTKPGEDTVDSLRAELTALRTEFDAFKAYAKPVIDGHQPGPPQPAWFKPMGGSPLRPSPSPVP